MGLGEGYRHSTVFDTFMLVLQRIRKAWSIDGLHGLAGRHDGSIGATVGVPYAFLSAAFS